MEKSMIVVAVLVSAVITFGLRALPFALFGHGKAMPPKMIYLGRILPSAIMAVLVVYCLKDVICNFSEFGIAEIIASAVVILSYKWRHNTLLSITLGTVCNMILLRII